MNREITRDKWENLKVFSFICSWDCQHWLSQRKLWEVDWQLYLENKREEKLKKEKKTEKTKRKKKKNLTKLNWHKMAFSMVRI